MPFFICPNCGNRELSGERSAGLSARPKGCSKCGFGFLFELLDDYYPAPQAAFFTCDQEGRVLDVGKNGFELTGLRDEDVIGRPVKDVLGLEWIDKGDGGESADTDSYLGTVEDLPSLIDQHDVEAVVVCADLPLTRISTVIEEWNIGETERLHQ